MISEKYKPYQSHREKVVEKPKKWTDEERRKAYRELIAMFPAHPQREWWEKEATR